MARSYVGYDEFLKTAQEEAEQQQLAYAAARQQRAQDTITALTTATAREIGSLQQRYRTQAERTENDYRSLYDENAIKERVARLNVEEAMTNMGLTDSGLSRTQQTALSATRMRADAQASAEKQAALDALLLSLNESVANSHQTLLERSADVLTGADQDIEKNAQSLYANATARAKTQFDADVDYVNQLLANERSEAEQASKQALADANLQLQREKQEGDQELAQRKFKNEQTLARSKYENEQALAQQKLENERALAQQKLKNQQALEQQKLANNQALAQQKLDNDLQIAQQKASASASKSSSSGSRSSSSSSSSTSASERAKNLKTLQELLEKRVNIFNPEWRANYDELIEYYKTLVYGS